MYGDGGVWNWLGNANGGGLYTAGGGTPPLSKEGPAYICCFEGVVAGGSDFGTGGGATDCGALGCGALGCGALGGGALGLGWC